MSRNVPLSDLAPVSAVLEVTWTDLGNWGSDSGKNQAGAPWISGQNYAGNFSFAVLEFAEEQLHVGTNALICRVIP